ncbi:hypothetical protein JCM3774_003467 [Rhodotorula dairenensis]
MIQPGDAGPASSLLDRIRDLDERDASVEERQPVIVELAQTLARDAHDLRTEHRAVSDTVFDDPFPLFDFLVPALTFEPDAPEATLPAQEWLCLVAQHSSPREVIMAVEQHQASLGPSRLEVDSDADHETWRAFSARHAALIHVGALATNRIDSQKRARFIESLCSSIRSTTFRLVPGGAYGDRPRGLGAEPVVVETVRQILHCIRATLACLPDGPPDEQRTKAMASLRTLLLDTVCHFHRYISVDCAGELYRSVGIGPRQQPLEPPALNRQLWNEILVTCRALECGPLFLLSTSIDSRHPPTYLGAFILLIHLISSSSDDLDPEELGLNGRELFRHGIVLRVAAQRDADVEIDPDEALFWAWWTVDSFLQWARESTYGLDSALMDILNWINPLAVDSPDPRTRFLAFRLVARCLLYAEDGKSPLADENLQLDLLTELVVECPDERLRAAAVGLVKELVLLKRSMQTAEGPKSIFLDEQLFATPLGKAITTVPWRRTPGIGPPESAATSSESLAANDDGSDPGCETFLRDHLGSTMERLSLAFVLLSRSNTRQAVAPWLKKQLLDPLASCLPAWFAYAREQLDDADAVLELDLVQNLLARVQAIAAAEAV